MNKKVIILFFLTLLLITVWDIRAYVNSNKEIRNELDYYKSFVKKIYQIRSLETKYSTKPLKLLNKICKISQNPGIYTIKCKINKKSIGKISYFLKSNIKIKSFSVKENGSSVYFYAEIYK